jgi:hypothetical protein
MDSFCYLSWVPVIQFLHMRILSQYLKSGMTNRNHTSTKISQRRPSWSFSWKTLPSK